MSRALALPPKSWQTPTPKLSQNVTTSLEIERVTQQLANRVKELEERYAEPLPQLVDEVEVLSSKVEEYLRTMGLEWD